MADGDRKKNPYVGMDEDQIAEAKRQVRVAKQVIQAGGNLKDPGQKKAYEKAVKTLNTVGKTTGMTDAQIKKVVSGTGPDVAIKLPNGKTFHVDGGFATDYGIKDLKTLEKAIKQGVGGERGLPGTIDGKHMLVFGNGVANNPGLRSAGRETIGSNLFAVDSAGFNQDHKIVTGPGSDLFNIAMGTMGAMLGGAGLMGQLGGAGATAAESGLAGWTQGGGAATSLDAVGTAAGAVGGGSPIIPEVAAGFGGTGAEAGSLLNQGMQGLTAADAAAGAQSLGVGATPGVAPAATGGFTAAQLTAAGIAPAAAGLPAVAGPSVAAGTAAGASSSIWQDIAKSLIGGGAQTAGGNLISGAIQGLIGAGTAAWNKNELEDLLRTAIEASDPFRSQYGHYQNILRDIWGNQDYLQNNSAFQAGMQGIRARNAKYGDMFSGTGAARELQTGIDKQIDLSRAVAPLAGNFGPGNAGSVASNIGGQMVGQNNQIAGNVGFAVNPLINKASDWMANQILV